MARAKKTVETDIRTEGKTELKPEDVKNVRVHIGERTIPLKYTMRAQLQVEQELEMEFFELQQKIDKAKRCTKETISALRIMGNEGLRLDGQEPDLTEEWLIDHMEPAQMLNYRIAVMAAMIEGWYMETDTSYEEEQDETLNELRKKNESTD